MKNFLRSSSGLVMAFSVLASAPAFAAQPNVISTTPPTDTIRLGTPVIRGSGCPANTATAILSPDGSAITVLFDQYVAQTDLVQEKVYKSCNVAIPVHVPQGLSVSLLALDYRGYYSVPQNGAGSMTREYFFAGTHGDVVTEHFYGDGNIELRDEVAAASLVWSACGAQVLARANTSVLAERSVEDDQQTLVAIDSIDVTGSLVFHLGWKTCH